ncbi:hypothetical protein KSP35_08475 [Aquihabitans sp. G128]|uniref:hypothetical protein n=1 Tax=Aquihabitans sp. G128 TaxID=2849779 RepID=UPI001C2145D3|nr:hypothetical protein [Aquihabitans sp. G128]QXC62799.1 hypothetical protein KSP35_08475 [Aquihabitans sp. G128]
MPRRPALLALAAVALVLGLAGCGAHEGRTALAVRSTRWVGPDELAVTVECAEVSSADVEPGKGVDGLPLLTVWGEPSMGRCASQLVIPVPPGVDRIDDAATGMVVDLPPRP